MASKEIAPDGAEIWRCDGGEIRLWLPAPGVICTRYAGDMLDDLAAPMRSFYLGASKSAPTLTFFGDAEHVTSYSILFRMRVVLTLQEIRNKTDQIHIFVTSSLQRSAAYAVNIVLGNLIPYATRAAFEAERAKLVAARKQAS